MKIRSYNGSEHIPEECGSFTIVSRELNKEFKNRGIYSEDEEAYVIVPECLNTRRQFKNQIPLLASEYSHPPQFVISWLQEYMPITFCISEFARQNLIRGGYPKELLYVSHLGSDTDFWKPLDIEKDETFTFLSVNSSNDRSGFEILIPEFIKFARGKHVNFLIKDGNNPQFKKWVSDFRSNKIFYLDAKLNKDQLKWLYNKCHIHIYYNHTTSFGLTGLDAALCGTPSLITLGSAPKEFYPPWTQPIPIKTTIKPLDSQIIQHWQSCGLHVPPCTLYPPGTFREALDSSRIQESLQYAYDNYLEMLNTNQQHQEYIKQNLTWSKCVDRILSILDK